MISFYYKCFKLCYEWSIACETTIVNYDIFFLYILEQINFHIVYFLNFAWNFEEQANRILHAINEV